MKNLLIAFCLLPVLAFSQRIKVNKYDKFIKKWVIETSTSSVLQGKSSGMYISFKSVGTDIFVTLKGYGTFAAAVTEGDEVIFLLENDSTVTAKSIGLQTIELGLGVKSDAFTHQYNVPYSSLEQLTRYHVVGLRKYNIKGSNDVFVPAEKQGEIRNMCLLLLSDMAKAKQVAPARETVARAAAPSTRASSRDTIVYVKAINLQDIPKHIGENVTVCGKVYTARYLASSKSKPTLLNIGAPYPDQLLTVAIPEEARNSFGQNPETFFLEKEVCITGKLEMYNGRPEIIVKTQGQLTLNKSVSLIKTEEVILPVKSTAGIKSSKSVSKF